MASRQRRPQGFDTASAVTRSLLGYGVLAGGFYLAVGLLQAVTREGFDLTRHPLSLLMLGDWGWVQRANLILTGLMVVAAAAGFARALRRSRAATRAGVLLAVYGLALVASGTFAPDPMQGFPLGAAAGEASLGGVLHLASGAAGFVALAAAAFVVGGWFAGRGDSSRARRSRLAGAVVLGGFAGGAALSTQAAGVGLLWLAVLAGWAWLAATSVHLYRDVVAHPDPGRRVPKAP